MQGTQSGGLPAPSHYSLALDWIRAEAPRADSGKGGHDATFKTVCFLRNGFELSDGELVSLMECYNAEKCVPPWSAAEIAHKVQSSAGVPGRYAAGWMARRMLRERGHGGGAWVAKPRADDGVAPEPRAETPWRLPFDFGLLEREARRDLSVDHAWFAERSPLPPDSTTPAKFLDAVFLPGECSLVFDVFGSQGQFGHISGKGSFRLGSVPGAKPVRSELPRGGRDGIWFLINPVTGKWAPNPRSLDAQGRPKMSRRSQESITAQRHIVLECDHRERACDCRDCNGRDNPNIAALWLNFLAQLPFPIVAIYSSGGKSFHALLRMNFEDKSALDVFKKRHGGMLSKFGADPKAWSPTQLSRLPGCFRGEREQKLIYLNPNPDPSGHPISEGGGLHV